MSVKKTAEAYINGTYRDSEPKLLTVADRLTRFSFPFISDRDNLCINLRAFPAKKRINGNLVKMPGIIICLEDEDDVRSLMSYLEEVLENKEVLRQAAETRRKRWIEKSRSFDGQG